MLDSKSCPSDGTLNCVKDNNPLGTQKTVLLDFDDEKGLQGNFKISKLITFKTCFMYVDRAIFTSIRIVRSVF